MLDYFVSLGLDFNLANGKGETPFYVACHFSTLDAVQYLAHKGVDINEVNAKSRLTPREVALKDTKGHLKSLGFTLDDLEALNDLGLADDVQRVKAITSFIDTWNRKVEFVEEVGDFADETWLSNMLFQSYCSGEAMAEPSEQG